eukprot:CAMPEP_0206053204 /NCGR_PEP_ID=MMETSP1466-20131121/35379_1 /ASSEMBLY_ACC=CAM_ASM_001126 /TAXON_ID=44452 /ORGANISM="Pavlova gyrans, Strain CCMP608" /LENGTH=41 /DNA_ID= /DNA_START= /DNA_END= /DNA_ORIENTATION=
MPFGATTDRSSEESQGVEGEECRQQVAAHYVQHVVIVRGQG